jgi:hypothetical protein
MASNSDRSSSNGSNAVADVGRFSAGVVVAVVGGKVTSAFPDKSIQKRLGLARTARSARLSSLAQDVIRRIFWMARWSEGAAETYSSRDKE